MNLNHLSLFHAVALDGSISRAADRLLVSQPAVSKQLIGLEKSLKTKLFDRIPRGVRLTAAGKILFNYTKRIFALEAEAREAIEGLAGLKRGKLAIGASTTIGVYLLPEIFVEFRKRYPAIDITVEVASSAIVQQRLMDDSLHVGFTEVIPEDSALENREFMADQLVAIAPPGHAMLAAKRVTPEQFCCEPFVVRATGSDTKSFVERALSERGVTVHPAMALGSTEAIKRAVSVGVGVSIVSRLSITLELKAKTLGIVRLWGLDIRRPLYCVQRKERHTSAALAAFLSLVEETVRRLSVSAK